jgi:hypothetical protein
MAMVLAQEMVSRQQSGQSPLEKVLGIENQAQTIHVKKRNRLLLL